MLVCVVTTAWWAVTVARTVSAREDTVMTTKGALTATSGEQLLCTGCNFFGQLGIGYRTRPQPDHVPSTFGENGMGEQITPEEIQDIQCGTQFTVVVKKTGEVPHPPLHTPPHTLPLFSITLSSSIFVEPSMALSSPP
jgi:hypothetical protein